jgi:hypothetical protein
MSALSINMGGLDEVVDHIAAARTYASHTDPISWSCNFVAVAVSRDRDAVPEPPHHPRRKQTPGAVINRSST